jgi:hypothetical protein
MFFHYERRGGGEIIYPPSFMEKNCRPDLSSAGKRNTGFI